MPRRPSVAGRAGAFPPAMHAILFDVESRSRVDLRRVGGRNYWEHPSTAVLVIAWAEVSIGTEDEPDAVVIRDVGTWHEGEPVPAWVAGPLPVGAHNGRGFDRFAVHRLGWLALDDARLFDTADYAKRAGLAGSLDALGSRFGIPKDKDASRYTVALSTARRPVKHTAHLAPGGEVISEEEWRRLPKARKRELGALPELTREVQERVDLYCLRDVETMARAWAFLAEWAVVDADVAEADTRVNDRGFGFDRELAHRLLQEDARLASEVMATVATDLGWTATEVRRVANSSKLFPEFTGAPNAKKSTVDAILAEAGAPAYATPQAVPLATARRALASIARGKLTAALLVVSPDGRLRDSMRYYGGHTGRWAGKAFQPQNLPRPSKAYEDFKPADAEALAERILAGGRANADEINVALRSCICAPPGRVLVDYDFTGVESRFLAWAARDFAELERIAEGVDPYKVAAAAIASFNCTYETVTKTQRAVGKVAVLACGYQGGAGALERMAAGMGVDLHSAGVDPADVVTAWRAQHAPIVRFWRALETAMRDVLGDGKWRTVGGLFTFVRSVDAQDVCIILPSGRPIVYNGARLSTGETWPDGRPKRGSISYQGRKGQEHLYGGKICENVVQAACRDLMTDVLVRVERAGLSPVLTVHDQILCEVDEADASEAETDMHAQMISLPSWAYAHGSGWFPIAADGHVSRRHAK